MPLSPPSDITQIHIISIKGSVGETLHPAGLGQTRAPYKKLASAISDAKPMTRQKEWLMHMRKEIIFN